MKKILVVDDNLDVLEVIRTLLDIRGYKVFTLPDGGRVIEIAKKFSPDLILLDVYLSGYNGIDLCRPEIKSAIKRHSYCYDKRSFKFRSDATEL